MDDAVQSLLRKWPRPSLENVAGDLGQSIWAVRKWHSRKRIPAEFWADLVAAAGRRRLKGVTLERLAELHSRSVGGHTLAEARP
jgi:hypothetical protein